jgi:hypothetical protein
MLPGVAGRSRCRPARSTPGELLLTHKTNWLENVETPGPAEPAATAPFRCTSCLPPDLADPSPAPFPLLLRCTSGPSLPVAPEVRPGISEEEFRARSHELASTAESLVGRTSSFARARAPSGAASVKVVERFGFLREAV